MDDNADIMTYRDTAEVLRIPEPTVRALVSQRRIPFIRISARIVRFSRRDLMQWISDHACRPQSG